MGVLTIKHIGNFNNGAAIEDVIILGIEPLLELAETIDIQSDPDFTGAMSSEKAATLNRLMAQGLQDVEEALHRVYHSYKSFGIDIPQPKVNLKTDLSGAVQKIFNNRVADLKKAYKKDHRKTDMMVDEILLKVTG